MTRKRCHAKADSSVKSKFSAVVAKPMLATTILHRKRSSASNPATIVIVNDHREAHRGNHARVFKDKRQLRRTTNELRDNLETKATKSNTGIYFNNIELSHPIRPHKAASYKLNVRSSNVGRPLQPAPLLPTSLKKRVKRMQESSSISQGSTRPRTFSDEENTVGGECFAAVRTPPSSMSAEQKLFVEAATALSAGPQIDLKIMN